MAKGLQVHTSQMKLPKVGQKIHLAQPYEFDLMQVIPIGAKGTVVEATRKNIVVKMDEVFESLKAHDNCISFYEDATSVYNGMEVPPVLDFFVHCRWFGE